MDHHRMFFDLGRILMNRMFTKTDKEPGSARPYSGLRRSHLTLEAAEEPPKDRLYQNHWAGFVSEMRIWMYFPSYYWGHAVSVDGVCCNDVEAWEHRWDYSAFRNGVPELEWRLVFYELRFPVSVP